MGTELDHTNILSHGRELASARSEETVLWLQLLHCPLQIRDDDLFHREHGLHR